MKKFRALTKEGNMIEVKSIQFMEDGSYIVNKEFPIEEGKLLQWTGFKDMDEKEIYEGDIILVDEDSLFGDPKTIKEVIYFEGTYLTGTPNTTMREYLFEEAGYCEVIGNIFQNPELLK